MKVNSIKNLIINNLKIIENYIFMTIVQVIGSLIGILIYPYLFLKLGAESYGLYVFAFSITNYFFKIISFGFSMPALKAISQNTDNTDFKSDVISSVISAKFYLSIISTILFVLSIYSIPFLYQNKWVYLVCFSQIISEIYFPLWYFQAIQKMRIVAFIQVGIRILSLPFIFIYVKNDKDILIYALIVSISNTASALSAIKYLKNKENISIYFVPIKKLRIYFKDAIPFFWSSTASVLKTESITTIIGVFFNMTDVAQYDLANKILQLPRIATSSINDALFPKLIKNTQQSVIKKILKYEILLGLAVILGVIIFGHWLVILLGGIAMVNAYPLTILLSVTILQNLMIGSYYVFIFVPNNRYYFITKNQILAFFSFFIICMTGVYLIHNIFVIVSALVLSGSLEIVYCKYLIKKYKLS